MVNEGPFSLIFAVFQLATAAQIEIEIDAINFPLDTTH